jgi:D-lactate dehydrogenase
VITTAVFDTKPYDRQALQQISANHAIEWHFLEFRLTEDTASAANNAAKELKLTVTRVPI